MKNVKRVLSLILVSVMVLAMSMPVFATSGGDDSQLTINSKTGNHQYEVYELVTGEFKELDGKKVIVEAKFGTGLSDTFKAGYNNDAYKFLEDVEKCNGDGDQVLALVKNDLVLANAIAASDATALTGLKKGYYLIKDVDGSLDNLMDPDTNEPIPDAYTKWMLKVIDEEQETATAKMDVPEVQKKVKETNDTTGTITNWQDGADYDIGDEIPFQLSTTIINADDPVKPNSKVYDLYETYKLVFHDTMSKGLTYKDQSVKIYVGNSTDPLQGGYTVTATKDQQTKETELVITIADTKDAAVGANADDVIRVEFIAILNSDAVIGSMGNPNKVYLEFSNNPNDEGTGKTPEDKVIVFTYKLKVNKIKPDGSELEGAGFTLYKEVPTNYVAQTGETVKEIAGKKYLQIGSEITGVTTFEFKGIDAGNYRLVETTVPTGYNKAQDVTFTIKATYDTNSANPRLTGLEVTDVSPADATFNGDTLVDYLSQGLVETSIVNNKGVELPETGGIGTTIFYIVGAVMVLGAGVVLVTRRRVQK